MMLAVDERPSARTSVGGWRPLTSSGLPNSIQAKEPLPPNRMQGREPVLVQLDQKWCVHPIL